MYRYALEKGSKKYICPQCGKKTFVKYINTQTKEYLAKDVGRCDREINCAYHYSPKDYFKDNKMVWQAVKEHDSILKIPVINKRVSYISTDVMDKTLAAYEKNNFVQYLKILFPDSIVNQLVKKFYIGTSKRWTGATIFWQIDDKYKVRSGKILLYKKLTGKRTNKITWVHSVLKLKDYHLKQCLFGLHQFPENQEKIIGIVESEKTAIIMTGLGISEGILDNYIWMATGSLMMLKPELIRPLKNCRIVLYPDLGIDISGKGSPYKIWSKKMKELKRYSSFITISDLLEKNADNYQREKGYDIADFVIESLKHKNVSYRILSDKNPLLKKMVDVFNLHIEKQSRFNL